MSGVERLKMLFGQWKEWMNGQEIDVKSVLLEINALRYELLYNKTINIEFPDDKYKNELEQSIMCHVFGIVDDIIEAVITRYADYWLDYKV